MKLGKTALTLTIALGILVVPLAADAQQPVKVPRVGYLSASSPSDPARQRGLEAFRQGLRELGYLSAIIGSP